MRTEAWLDIIFGAVVLPGMMFLFPTKEWFLWQPGYVVGYMLWLYGVWAMDRLVLGPVLYQQGGGSKVTVAGVVFLMVVVTFLMSLTPVNFPNNSSGRVGEMLPHVRAMWVLFLLVNTYALTTGVLCARIRSLSTVNEAHVAHAAASKALEMKRSETGEMAGEEIQIKADYKVIHLPLSAIQYIEGRNNYACFHLDHRDDVVSQISLKSVMDLLPEGKFTRIHRSYIVPVWRIAQRTSAEVKLMGVKERLPIGRAYKDNLKNG